MALSRFARLTLQQPARLAIQSHVARRRGVHVSSCVQSSNAYSAINSPLQLHNGSRGLKTSTRALAVQQFKLADIGEGIAEVQLTEWFIKEGDMIKEMDNICSVESDKASVELTSPYTGKVVKVHHGLQDMIKVGSVLVEIDVGGTAASSATKTEKAAAPVASTNPTPTVTSAAESAVQTFKLADIGEGIAEVQLTEWFVKEGDMVKEMDNLCSVESDKASVELTSPYTGKVVKIYHQLQETVKVGAALVDIQPAGSPGNVSTAQSSSVTPAKPSPPAASSTGGIQQFKLADIGEGIAEVQLTEWFVKEGDIVKEMDNLCSVESDKASVELTSPYSGKIVKIHHSLSDTVKVGAVLVDIQQEGSSTAPEPSVPIAETVSAPIQVPSSASTTPTPATSSSTGKRAPGVLATPKVRGLAREHNVDLNTVKGSGESGRVLASDVLSAIQSASSTVASSTPSSASRSLPITSGGDNVVEITDKVGKGMIKSMNASLQQPYMALGEEIDMTELIALSKKYKEFALKKYGVKITLTSFLIKAISLALDELPIVNSKFGPSDASPNYYTVFGSHNVSIAIDSPHGLVVPNIKDCANLSVLEIQQEVGRLAAAAKSGKLSMSDITGGTITFSNIGVIGTKDPRPILFDGQAVIGASGRTMTLPRYNDQMELEPRQIMNIRWVGDHRHLDGATLARFSNAFKRAVEEPLEWTLTLR